MTSADRRERERLIEEGHMAMGKPPGMTIVGGKPGDVPRFVPDDELNTSPRDERGHVRDGEPRTHALRLADLFEHGVLRLKEYRNGETSNLSPEDRDFIIAILRQIDDASTVCEMVCSASMGETRPMRGESSIGWQRGDRGSRSEIERLARKVIQPTGSVLSP